MNRQQAHWQRSAQDAAEQQMQVMRLASCMRRDFQYQEMPDEVDFEVDSDGPVPADTEVNRWWSGVPGQALAGQ